MKNLLMIAGIILFSTNMFAGGPKYQRAMGEALAGFAQCHSVADYQDLGNKFQMIANAESKEWLPLYYHAQCYILMSFTEREHPEKKDGYLDVAESSINKLLGMAPDESEAYVMQGLLFSARLMIDPMNRGQKYSAMSSRSIGRALGIEPANPRARYMQLANQMGTASFYGNDTSEYCDEAVLLLEQWDDYKIKSRIHPRWGKSEVAKIVKNCAKK